VKKLIANFVVLGLASTTPAATTFFVNPNPYPSWDSNLDGDWQTAVGGTFDEFDLDGYVDGSYVDSFATSFGVTVDVGLAGLGGTGPASKAEIFWGGWGGTSEYGTVYEAGLLNRDEFGVVRSQITFDFSSPVLGVGAWVYDNGYLTQDSFKMMVTDTNGTTTTSDVLESGNGLPHFIEGFLGATSTIGITSVAYEVITTHDVYDLQAFELDHIQIAQIPTPGALLLGSIGIGLVGYLRRKRTL